MAEHQRIEKPFAAGGIAVGRHDMLPPGKFPLIVNLRNFRAGALKNRRGIQQQWENAGRINGIRRIANEAESVDGYAVIWGTELRVSTSVLAPDFTSSYSGSYSGNAVSMITAKPRQSNLPWVYIGDSSKMEKVAVRVGPSVQVRPVGIRTPVAPVDARLAENTSGLGGIIHRPSWIELDALDNAANWTAYTTATDAVASRLSVSPLNVTNVVWDDAAGPGWGYLQFATAADYDNVGRGTLLTMAVPAGTALVQRVTPSWTAQLMDSVIYIPGSTLAWVKSTAIPDDIQVDDLLFTNAAIANPYVRVIATSTNIDAVSNKSVLVDFRVAGVTTASTIGGVQAVRCFMDATATSAGPTQLTESYYELTCTGEATSGTYLTAGTALDLSEFYLGTPVRDEDFLHISLRMDNPANVKEVRAYLGMDYNAGAPSPSDFHKNAFIAAFKADALAGAIDDRGTITDVNRVNTSLGSVTGPGGTRTPGGRMQDTGMDGYTSDGRPTVSSPNFTPRIPPSTGPLPTPAASPSKAQYRELFIRIGDLIRTGEAKNKTLANVNGLMLTVLHTGPVNVRFGSLHITGGYGPDVPDNGQPYYYRYRYRDSLTGARSNYSPPSRNGVTAYRQPLKITAVHTSTAAGYGANDADFIDIERWGGTVLDWRVVGTVPNVHDSGTAPVFYDAISDEIAAANGAVSNDDVRQPWVVIGTRLTGSITSSSGPLLYSSGGTFPTTIASGTIMRIAGKSYQIYRSLSANYLELYESVVLSSVTSFVIEEPIYESQPLPILFGPYEGFSFGAGDTRNPGRLYYSVGNDPDSHRLFYSIDLSTDPSEVVMNGLVWNGRCYAWTNKRMFQLLPSFDQDDLWTAQEVPGGRGLFAPHSLTGGPSMWWESSDGIYESDGGPARKISAEIDLLFQPEGHSTGEYDDFYGLGTTHLRPTSYGHGYSPAHATRRLAFYEDHLYYDFMDGGGSVMHTWVYDTSPNDPQLAGWIIDDYSEVDGYATIHYGDDSQTFRRLIVGMLGTAGRFCWFASAGPLYAAIVTPMENAGDPRTEKLWYEATLDHDTSINDSLTYTLYNDQKAQIATTGAFAGSNSFIAFGDQARRTKVLDINSGAGTEARLIYGVLTVTLSGGVDERIFYGYGFSYIGHPEVTIRRNTDFTDEGWPGNKLVRGIVIEADTDNASRSIQLIKDDGTVGATVTVQHNGRREKEYGFTPFETVLMRMNPADATEWQLYKYELIFDKHRQLATTPTPWDNMGDPRAKFVQGMLLEASTGGANVSIQIQKDEALQAVSPDLIVQHTLSDYVQAYSWEPFITHQVRIVPAGVIGIDRVTWIWEPEPELVTHWETQNIAFGEGYGHVKEIWMSVGDLAAGNQAFALELNVDNVQTTYAPAGVLADGTRQKLRFLVAPNKGRLFRFELTSASPFRLYAKDCEVHFKPWGSDGPYERLRPFGDEHVRVGARI